MTVLDRTFAGAIRPPKQDRSRATLDRVLIATEQLLEHNLFENLTLSDILVRSRVSVGAFYARFPNKEALVPCLYARYDRRLTEGAERVLDPERWRGRRLGERVALLFRYVVSQYRRNRGLMRALTLHARAHPDAVRPEEREHRSGLYDAAAALMLARRSEIAHPDPLFAVRFGLLMAGSTFREKILFDAAPHAQSVKVSDRELAGEATRAFLSYVGKKGRGQ